MLQLSHLKLLAGVFFALFVLTACGGSDSAAPAAGGGGDSASNDSGSSGGGSDTRSCTDAQFDNGTACVAKVTADKCNGDGYNGVNAATNTCIAYTQATCESASKFWDGTNCVAKVTSCTDQYLDVANNKCIAYTEATCTEFFNSSNQCVAVIDPGTCGSNQLVEANVCTDYTSATCQTDGKFWDTTSSTCEVKVTSCTNAAKPNLDAANNQCISDTQATCQTDGKFFDTTDDSCVAKVTSCTNQYLDVANNQCIPYVATQAGFYTNDEYTNSGVLASVKAAEAYANIAALTGTNVKQGGKGQTVSVADNYAFNTTHQEFGTDGAAFDSIYDASGDGLGIGKGTLYTSNADIIDNSKGNCNNAYDCEGTVYASLIAGRKGAVATNADKNMHGIAYNAQLRGIITDPRAIANDGTDGNPIVTDGVTQLTNALTNGVGVDIIAMNHVWGDEIEYACYAYDDAGTIEHRTYARPKGLNRAPNPDSTASDYSWTGTCTGTTANDTLTATELTAWQDAVGNIGGSDAIDGNTIMVFNNGGNRFNSENGQVFILDSSGGGGAVTQINAITLADSSKPMDANIPAFRAAYPALYANDDLKAGRWLTVVGLNTAGTEILSTANGCGDAMDFCLGAPAQNISVADADGRINDDYGDGTQTNQDYASATVAGGLAVLKGAFPNATPEQLTRLVLETSDYIELDNMTPDTITCNSGGFTCTTNFVAFTDPDGGTKTEDEYYRVQATKPDGTLVTKADGTPRYVNPVYGYGRLDMAAATSPIIDISTLSIGNNQSIGALWKDTQLTLSSHFGTGLDSVKLGIGDEYGRHFTVKANKITSAPVAVASLDEYMGNMLADNVQSEKLGGQAKLNYSNNAQPWMNLQYTSGKATSKIAFQDSYKIKPLNDTSATSILRANHIRPASNNIGMMDVDYALNGNLSLSSYAARGEYDTGYKFDELGTDFDVNYKDSHLNIAIGNIREHDQFLGTHTTGGYALNAPTVSRFTDVTYGHDVGNRFNIYANYINYETDVDMLHDQFASIDGLQADQYQVGFTGKSLISDDDNLNIALITKLGVTDGALNQNTTLGYTADGAFNDVSQSYDLAVSERHQQFEITYQGKIYQNSQDEVSVLKDNRFFTTIRVDQNLNHVQGASQTEIVSGINARF